MTQTMLTGAQKSNDVMRIPVGKNYDKVTDLLIKRSFQLYASLLVILPFLWDDPLGIQAAPSSIPTSGAFFRGDLVMNIFLRPFSFFQ